MGLSTYGLVLVKQDGDDDPEGPHLIRISMHPAFNRFMIKSELSKFTLRIIEMAIFEISYKTVSGR